VYRENNSTEYWRETLKESDNLEDKKEDGNVELRRKDK
jgi:hypothetical protein